MNKIMRIVSSSEGGETERMFNGVSCEVIGKNVASNPYIEVRVKNDRCPLVGNELYVVKECLQPPK